jgi:arabinofuranosyltransferase
MLQTLLVTSLATLLLRSLSGGRRVDLQRAAAGFIGGLACLTRLDSAVLVGTWFVMIVVFEWRGEIMVVRKNGGPDGAVRQKIAFRSATPAGHWRRAIIAAAALGLPLLAVLAPWLAWKWDYYGSLLPNTLTAKSAGFVVPFLYGIFYLLAFFASYFAFLLVKRYRKRRAEFWDNPSARLAFVPVGVWFLYTCVVGADFMEYRFMVPVIPILAILAAFLVNAYVNLRSQVVLVSVLLFASAIHLVAPSVIPYPVLTFQELHHWPSESKTSWIGLGTYLHQQFPGGQKAKGQPIVALQPLGAISYYSDLPVVDMLGLADKEIAEDGLQIPIYYPGHVRMATVPQLLDKDVSLIVGLPTFVDADPDRTSMRLSELAAMYSTADLKELPDDASIVEAPIVPGKVWFMIYLKQNDKVDALVANGTWRKIGIERTCDDKDLNVLTRVLAEKTCDGLERSAR